MVANGAVRTRETTWRDEVSRTLLVILPANQVEELISSLVRRGYSVIGPVVRDGAIVYDHVESADDRPKGWTDEQSPANTSWSVAKTTRCSAVW